MGEKKETIARFFPTREARLRASRAIDREASDFLSRYPSRLVAQVRQLKSEGLSLKEISDKLGGDPRIPEIAMHLAVKNQARDIGEA
ncbi:MAG: hypothetical protein DSY91_01410 [Deltaproteobacteria bacterium]|nr:MAG: hypothetical protein DSY91_01410 [Deltaproteobacteria bacterium]